MRVIGLLISFLTCLILVPSGVGAACLSEQELGQPTPKSRFRWVVVKLSAVWWVSTASTHA